VQACQLQEDYLESKQKKKFELALL